MKKFFLLVCVCSLAIFAGCSSKKHFEPKPIQSVSRQGAILKDNTLITLENGITPIVLEKGYKFLTQDGESYAIQKQCDEILIVRNGNENLHKVPFSSCVLTASLKGDKLAMVLIDNRQTKRDFFAKIPKCQCDKLLPCFTFDE